MFVWHVKGDVDMQNKIRLCEFVNLEFCLFSHIHANCGLLVTYQLQVVEETVVSGENHRLNPSLWQLSHMPRKTMWCER